MNMVKLVGSMALALSALGSAHAWVTTNVSTAAELIRVINKINAESDAYRSTILLAPGSYDVGSSHMQGVADNNALVADTFAHIAPRRMTIKGVTDDPRDTVIYGNAGSDRVVYSYNATLANLTVSNGYAKSSGSLIKDGGGAFSQNGHFTNVVFTCNHADGKGGGAYNGHYYDCKFIGNSSDGYGGGCAGYKGETYFCGFMYRCEIRGNYSAYNGGGTYGNYGEDCWIVGNTVKYHGGGDYSGELHRCVISNNVCGPASSTACGGGAYDSVLYDCDVIRNVAPQRGGGMCFGKAYDSRIRYNLVTNATGAVYGGGCDRALVVGGEIAGNALTGGPASETRQGGGAFSTPCTNCVIKNNFVFNGLGGATASGSFYGCVFSNNVTRGGSNGQTPQPSIRQVSGVMKNCDIYECALDVEGSMSNCRVMNYTNGNVLAKGDNAFTNGWFHGTSYLSVYRLCATNCLFAGIRLASPAILFHQNDHGLDSALVNCTVADCVADTTVVKVPSNRKFDVVNCIFSDNVSTDGSCNDLMYGTDAATVKFDHCLYGNALPPVTLVYDPVGMIQNANARFCRKRKPEAPYAIRYGSPARAVGKVMPDWMAGSTDVRHDPKYPRLRDDKVDLGCYQCWDVPVGMAAVLR